MSRPPGKSIRIGAAGLLPALVVAFAIPAAAAVDVGYYDMVLGQGSPDQVAPITTAGHTAVQMFTLSAAELSGVEVLFVQNPSNGGYGAEYVGALSTIASAVANDGLVLVIHDRYVDTAETILPGGSGFTVVRNFDALERNDLNVLDGTTLVTNGSAGTIGDTTLDGGNFSSHGYVLDNAALPADAVKILSRFTATQVATLSYGFGDGRVIYSTIPLDIFLAGGGANANFAAIYAPNVIEYAAVLAIPAPDLKVTKTNGRSVSVPGESTTYTLTVYNKGNADAVGATVIDGFPAALTGVTWTCTPTGTASCTASGSGNINDTVTVPPGDAVVYTATGTISSAATGTLTNTASATSAEDPFPDNNSATDVDTLEPEADLDLTKSGPSSIDSVDPSVSYTLTLTNNGPSDASGVILNDPTPAGLSPYSVGAPCTGGFPCTVGSHAAGAVVNVTVTFDVPSPYLGPDPIRNLAAASSTTPDPVASNNTAVAATAVDRAAEADLLVAVAGPPSAALGSTVTYRVEVTNQGTESAADVTLAAPTPSGLLFNSATDPCAAGVASCDLGSLGPDETVQVEVTYNIPGGYGGSDISFTASATSATTDPVPGDNSDTEVTPIGADTADLRVEKIGPSEGGLDEDLEYLITVSNLGPAEATGVTLTDPDPTGLTFVSASAPCDVSGFPCVLGTLAKGASIDVEATFHVPSDYADADPVVNVASVSATETEGYSADNTASAYTGLGGELADVSIEKNGPGSVAAGSTLTYALVVTNLGPGVASSVTVTEPTPTGLTFQSADSPCGAGFPCALGNLQPGAAAIVGVVYSVPANYVAPDPIANTATVATTGNVDPDTGNNSDSASTDVEFIADLAVTKDDGQATTSPGLFLTYTITVTNQGPSDVAGVTVTDTFPAELTEVSWTCGGGGGGSCGNPYGSANINETVGLPVGGSVTYTVGAKVDAGASGTLSNTASAAVPGGYTDPVTANNSATDEDEIRLPVDLRVEKSDAAASAVPGTDLVYTVTVTNDGPGTAYDAELTDPTPTGLTFKSATAPCTGGFPCALGDLNNLDVVPVTMTYEVPADYSGADPISNTATVSTTTPDTNAANDSATETTPVAYTADLGVVKNDGLDNLVPGTPVTYTIVVTNYGPSAVSGGTVTDNPPAELVAPITWTCTPSAGASCTASGSGAINDTVTLPVSGTLTYSLTATVAPNAQLAVINEVTVTVPAGYTDPVPGNNLGSDSSGLTPYCDLEVSKTNGLDEAVPGETVTYTMVVTNNGPSDAVGATVDDVIPTELTGVSWTCTPAGGASCDANPDVGDIAEAVDLPVGASVTFTIDGTIDPAATGTLENTATATVAGGYTDGNPANNTATDADPLIREADLVLRKVGPSTVDRGDPLVFTLELENQGPSTAAVTLTDPTPPGLPPPSVSPPCAAGFPCVIDPLAAGSTETITVTYQVPADYDGPDPIVNVAAVSSDAIDPDPSDNRASSATPVDRPVGTADVEVSKKAPAVSMIGSTVTYVLEVTNHGPADAQGVVLSETFPAGFVFNSATAPCTGGFACALGTIPVGAVMTVEVTLDIPPGYSGPTIVVNTASVTSTTTDPNPANDSANDSTTLIDDPIDLVLRKLGPLAVTPGDDLPVTLVVTQEGPGDATNVWLTDPTPAGLTFISATAPCQGGFPCFLDTVAMGETVTVEVVFNVPSGYAGADPIENVASIDANELDADTDSDTARLLTGVGAEAADVEVIKIGPSAVAAGAEAKYTITVRNLGPGLATGVVLADPAPAGTTFVAATEPCATGFPCALGDLESGSTVAVGATYRLNSALAASTVIDNVATGSTTSSDTDATNDSDTASTTSTVSADLEITKTDGVTTIPAGSAVTYVVTVTNLGPSDAPGVGVTDAFSAKLSGVTWTCAASAGSNCGGHAAGAGNLNQTVNLLAGGIVTYTVHATIDPGATGTLSNTATLTPPPAVPDPDTANNSATDVDTLTLATDLAITKTSGGGGTFIPGGQVTYTITVTNQGPSHAVGATVEDTFPAALTGVNWSCVASAGSSCTASGSTEILDGVDLLVGGTATYTVTATADSALTTNLVNTAEVVKPDGATDPDLSDNSATDTATPAPAADLELIKDDGQTTAVPGEQVIYTITVINQGPSDVVGATVDDTFPDAASTISWTCSGTGGATCGASGVDTLSDSVDIPAGDSVVYTVTVGIDPAATGTMLNESMVTNPVGIPDPDGTDNSDTDVDTLTPESDLAITKTDGQTEAVPGEQVVYTITVTNQGPSDVTGAAVSDAFPAAITGVSWTCSGTGGATCTAAGAGNINDSVNIPAGESITYLATATIDPGATGTVVNTATVSHGSDPTGGNNSATDTDTLTPESDLAITKTDGQTEAVPGEQVVYTITVTNHGPSDAVDAGVSDAFPAAIAAVSWTCSGTGGASCTASGTDNINDTVNIPVGETVTYLATATIDSGAIGTLINTATVSDPSDPVPGNNSASDTDTLTPEADLAITKTDGQTTAIPGGQVTYTITVTNHGPSDAVGATVTDAFPAAVTAVSWTCSGTPGASCTAAGNGNVNDTAEVPAGGSVTYLATVDINPIATGTLINTATVNPPGGVDDDALGNNSATDVDTLMILADLVITKTDGQTVAYAGGQVTYTIAVTNNGPGDVVGATVIDLVPSLLEGVFWTCVAAPAGSCGASGSDNIADTINLPSGSTATYTLTANLVPTANGNLVNTAQVDPPVVAHDANPANNTATDIDTIARLADLEVIKRSTPPSSLIQGSPIVYTITVANNGPSNTTGVGVTDDFPPELSGVSWTCSASSGASCPAGGSGDIDVLVDLEAGGQVTFTATATVSVAPPATISNTAGVTPEAGVGDPDANNNSATVKNSVGELIFADGFESGNVSAWSSAFGY